MMELSEHVAALGQNLRLPTPGREIRHPPASPLGREADAYDGNRNCYWCESAAPNGVRTGMVPFHRWLVGPSVNYLQGSGLDIRDPDKTVHVQGVRKMKRHLDRRKQQLARDLGGHMRAVANCFKGLHEEVHGVPSGMWNQSVKLGKWEVCVGSVQFGRNSNQTARRRQAFHEVPRTLHRKDLVLVERRGVVTVLDRQTLILIFSPSLLPVEGLNC